MILGFDPGRDKCGVAILNRDREINYHQVIASQEVISTITELTSQFKIELIVMGNLTTSKTWYDKLKSVFNEIAITTIDERNSTLEARDRYWEMYPPQGLKKLLPQGLLVPPRPIDDIVAILLIERYLDKLATD